MSRAEFETLMSSTIASNIEKDEAGNYKSLLAEYAWMAWKEASRQMRGAAAKVAHDLDDRTSARCIRAIPIE